MPEIEDGFQSIAIDRLIDIDKLLGAPGGMHLDTRVIAHWSPPRISSYGDIVINIGAPGHPITIADVCHALLSIPQDAWQRGRSYCFEGIRVSADKRAAEIVWGS